MADVTLTRRTSSWTLGPRLSICFAVRELEAKRRRPENQQNRKTERTEERSSGPTLGPPPPSSCTWMAAAALRATSFALSPCDLPHALPSYTETAFVRVTLPPRAPSGLHSNVP